MSGYGNLWDNGGCGTDSTGGLVVDALFPILIAEDDENDALIIERALRKAGFANPFHVCSDGTDVIAYVTGKPPYEDRQKFVFPRILITDLKMPKMDGLELLEWLKNNPACGIIPTIVLTASRQESDIQKAYQLGANSYLVKPTSFDRLTHILRMTLEYWEICEKPLLPTKC